MKIQVQVDDREYEVEIEDLRARPIVAIVEGERVEVWPEGMTSAAAPRSTRRLGENGNHAIRAPIPGVIVAVSVKPGDKVSVGQEVCVLEAMKMRNPIRAHRAGIVAAVPIAPGQLVRNKEVLVDLTAV